MRAGLRACLCVASSSQSLRHGVSWSGTEGAESDGAAYCILPRWLGSGNGKKRHKRRRPVGGGEERGLILSGSGGGTLRGRPGEWLAASQAL